MAPLQKIGFSDDRSEPEEGEPEEKRRKSKRKRGRRYANVPEWDPASGKWRSVDAGGKRSFRTLVLWVGLVAALVAVIYFFVKTGENGRNDPAAAKRGRVQTDNAVSVPLMPPGEEAPDPNKPSGDAE